MDSKPAEPSNRQLLKWMFSFLRPVKGIVVLACLFLALWTGAEISAVRITALAVDQIKAINLSELRNVGMWDWLTGNYAEASGLRHVLAVLAGFTLTIGVLERTREIGMIRAVGGTRKQIRNIVVVEALLLAAIGAVFGIVGGLYLGYVFVSGVKIIFPMGYFFPVSGILAAVVIGLLFGGLAAIIPARQAARLEIVQALRYE